MEMETDKVTLEERIQKGSRNIDEYFELGSIYLNDGEYDHLLVLYDQLKQMKLSSDQVARLYNERGEACQLLNRTEEAIDNYRQSLANIHLEMEAAETLGLAAENHYQLFLLLPDQEQKDQHSKEALKYYHRLLETFPDFPWKYAIYTRAADLYGRTGDLPISISLYKSALEIASDLSERVWALVGIAVVNAIARKWKSSEEYFKQAINEAGGEVAASKIYFERGKMLFDMRDFQKARESFQEAASRRKADVKLRSNEEYWNEILLHLGIIDYELGHYREAAKYFQELLKRICERHIFYANCHLVLGHVYFSIGAQRKARSHYSKVITAPKATDEEIRVAKKWLARIPLEC